MRPSSLGGEGSSPPETRRSRGDAGVPPSGERRVLRRHGHPARIGAGERIRLRQRLEAAGRGLQPGTIDRVQRRAHGLRVRGRRYRGHRVEGRRVDLPGSVRVEPRHLGRGRSAQRVRSPRRERRQRAKGVGQGRLAELRPDPAAPGAVCLLEREGPVACGVRRLAFELPQGAPQGRLLPFVVRGPGRRIREQLPLRTLRGRLAQQVRHPRMEGRRLRETPPDRLPCSFPPAEPLRRDDLPVPLRVEPEVRHAPGCERTPATGLPAGACRFRIAHPCQHVPHRIVGEEPVEVHRFEAPAPQRLHRGGRQLLQGAQQGLPGGRIARDVQPETAAVPGCEERLHRPVPAVSLRPADPPVLELDQRFQRVRAGVGGAELLAARAGQVDDGGRIGGKPGRRQRPVDHAPQPDRRAGAFLGIVFAEHQKLRQDGAEPRHGGAPPGIAVGPQDGGGRLRVVGVAGGGGFERGGQGLDDGGGRRRRVHHPDPPMRYGRARPPAITASGAVGAPPIRACSTIMSGRSAPASAPHRGSGRNPS